MTQQQTQNVIMLQHDIPIPPKMPFRGGAARKGISKYPFSIMNVSKPDHEGVLRGDSFLFPRKMKPSTAHTTTAQASKRLYNGDKRKFIARSTEDGMRCWRIA